MRDAIAWSYDLLTESEQGIFRLLAVFEGGFTLSAVTAVPGSGADVLPALSALEAASLVKLRPNAFGDQRFFMLETIREFALERLRELGEESDARQAHAAYVTRLADDTERMWWESGGLDKLDELEPEIPNIRVALAWLQQAGEVPELLRLAGSIAPLWGTRGYSLEGRAWLEWGLARSDGTPTTTVMVALRALAWTLIQQDDYYRSLLVAQHALELSEEMGDSRNRVANLTLSGLAAARAGYLGLSKQWYTTALNILDSCAGEAWEPVSRCIVMDHLGGLALGRGDIDQAEVWYTRMKATLQTLGFRYAHASEASRGLGDIARARGDPVRALDHYQVSLHQAVEANDIRAIARVLGSIAGALSAMGRHEVAGRLFGASEALHERLAVPFVSRTFARQRAFGLPEPWASSHPECSVAEGLRRTLWDRTAKLRAVSLDPEKVRLWWEEGRSLDLDAALALIPALEPGQDPREARPAGLSPREIEVLRLLAQGHTDREIAALLHISHRTVQNHVQHIYGKINVSSRSSATKWSLAQGIA
jgi:non-specific serine/threonine protein kinase